MSGRFDNSLVINLASRPERLAAFRERWGNEVEVLEATKVGDVNPVTGKVIEQGWMASLVSHWRAVRQARARGWSHLVVFEDDAVPGPCWEERLKRVWRDVPPGFAVLNLGGVDWKMPTDHVKGSVFRVADKNHTWIECYVVNGWFFDVWERALKAQAEEGRWFADTVLEWLQHVFPVYATMPGVVWQERGWSDNHGARAWTDERGLCPVPGWFRDDEGRAYLEEVCRRKVKRLVEVGVCEGRSTSWVAGEVCLERGGTLWAVDLFEKCRGSIKGNRKSFEWHMWKMGVWEKGLQVLQQESVKAAAGFEDGSLDMVFVDADHAEKSVEADIGAWLPKVRNGGVICGHDYGEKAWPGVKKAVDRVLGAPDRVVGTFWLKEVSRAE